MVTENYGFIGIIGYCNNVPFWDYFEEEPEQLCEVYALTEEGYNVFHSWNEEGGYENLNEKQIFQMLTTNEEFSSQID